MADIKNFGLKGVSGDLQLGKSGGRVLWDGSNTEFDFAQSDGTTLANVSFNKATADNFTFSSNTSIVLDGAVTDLANASETTVATSDAIKTYVDEVATSADLDFQGDSGTGAVDLDSQALDISGGTGIETSAASQTLTVTLSDTAVTAGTYGNATSIPSFTVDQQGRLTAASNVAIQTSWTLTGDSGSETVDGGDTVLIAGGDNITTAVTATDTATINLDTTLTGMTAATFSGTVQAGTFTDGTLTINAGEITGATDITATGTIQGNTLRDSILTINGGSITGGVQAAFSDTVTAGNLDASGGLVTFNQLSDGTLTMDAILDEDNMASDSNTALATQQSIKSYVDSQITLQGAAMNIQGDGGTPGSIVFATETLTVAGSANEIETSFDGVDTLTIGLPDDVTMNNVTVTGTLTSDDITSTSITVDGDLNVSGDTVMTGNLTVQGETTIINSNIIASGDAIIALNADLPSGATPVDDMGLEMNRGAQSNVHMLWKEGVDYFEFGNELGTLQEVRAGTFNGTTLTDGTATLTGGDLTTSGTVNAGTVEFDNLSGTGAVSVTDIIDDDTMATASATNIATSESIKAYVDSGLAGLTSNLDVAGDTGTDIITLGVDTFNVVGTANEIETAATANTITVGIATDPTLPGNVTLTGDLVTGSGTGGTITGATLISGNSIVGIDNVVISGYTIDGVIDDDTMATASNTTVATSESTKAYIDAGLAGLTSNLDIAGDTGTDVITLGVDTFNVVGTTNEIETAATANTITIGLPNDVTIGNNLTVTAHTTTDTLEVTGTSTLTGNVQAGNIEFSGKIVSSTGSGGTITGATLVSANSIVATDNVVINGFTVTDVIDDDTMASASATSLATSESIKAYVDAEVGGVDTDLNFAADTGTLLNHPNSNTVTFAGTTDEIETSLSGNILTIGIVDNPTFTGDTISTGAYHYLGKDKEAYLYIGDHDSGSNYVAIGTYNPADPNTWTSKVYLAGTGKAEIDNYIAGQGNLVVESVTGSANVTAYTNFKITADSGSLNKREVELFANGTMSFGAAATGNVDLRFGNDPSVTISSFIDDDTMATASATSLATSESIKAYVDAQISASDAAANLAIAGDTGSDTVDLEGQTLTVAGTANEIETSVTGQTVTVGLVDNPTVSGDLTVNGTSTLTGEVTAGADLVVQGNLTVNGTTTTVNSTAVVVEDSLFHFANANPADTLDIGFFGDYVDGSTKYSGFARDASDSGTWKLFTDLTQADLAEPTHSNVIDFANASLADLDLGVLTSTGITMDSVALTGVVTEAEGLTSSDNDTSFPTTAAVIDYVDNNAGDGLALRTSFTANSAVSEVDIGTVPNVTARTYYGMTVRLNVATGFTGGSVDHVLVVENNGTGTTLVAEADADILTAGTYVIELSGNDVLTKNATVQLQFKQANGTTAAVVTGGVVNATVSYHWA